MKLSAKEASQRLNISSETIMTWNKKGLIKSVKSELNYSLFDFDELDKLNQKFNNKSELNNYKILKSSKKTNYGVIELFAGAGGTSLGFENAGLSHILLNEFNRDAVATLRKNFPNNTNIVLDDVANLDFKTYRNVDVVPAGFPCQ
ncbi:MAG: DNA cytosine methyltransferase, partial [Alphaproteobacteria bacterium]